MLYVGIDVAKRKHTCFMINEHGEVLSDVFTIQNSMEGFSELQRRIKVHQPRPSQENTRVGLEATGHYSDNIIAFLRRIGLGPIILNPLRVNLYLKGQNFRKTKTDKSDAKSIAKMIAAEKLTPHLSTSYHSEELKSLTRHRHRIVKNRSMHKVLYDRLLTIVFPELEGFISDTLGVTILKLMLEFPGAEAIRACHLTRLTNLVKTFSRGRYDKDWAIGFKELAAKSIGSTSPAKAYELKYVIRQIISLTEEVALVEKEIKSIVISSGTTLMTIPGIGYTIAAVILAEVGDITRFATPAKLQAFAGLDPTQYQSGQFEGKRNRMVKRGSSYLRWALLTASRIIGRYDKIFGEYLDRKIAEGKHYNSAMGHVAKKLVRVIFRIMNTGEVYLAKG
jgi:transposase